MSMLPATPSFSASAEPSLPVEPARPRSAEALATEVGESLFKEGLLDAAQLAYARQKQAISRLPLWRIVIDEGLASEQRVVRILAAILQLDYVEVENAPYPTAEALALFNKEQCMVSNFLPLRLEGRHVVILLGDALPSDVAQVAMQRRGLHCHFLIGAFTGVAQLIRNTYHFARNPPEKMVDQEIAKLSADRDHIHPPDQLLNHLLHFAVRERATDIHVTQGRAGLHILFRIDGVLQPIRAIPKAVARLIGFVKISAEMDISEHRRPQDGSFRTIVLDEPLTIRVSTLITEHGERVVMRLLPEAHDIKDLAALGFFEADVAVIARAMTRPAGLILITGPTGSGKSSTLHAGLRMQHLIERNVLTVEDPLEYRVALAGQTEVNRKAGYGFATALRHFLRHDPDVILVGEMRDAETAQAALDAAATGHLVLSTLHVTTAFGVVPRLMPFGIPPQVIAENLLLIINQRLVRRLCPFCCADCTFTSAETDWLGIAPGSTGKMKVGCDRCRGTGFYGRLPLYEILTVDDAMANAIADDIGREAIRALAERSHFKPIGHCAKERVIRGQTTANEVFRAIGEGPGE